MTLQNYLIQNCRKDIVFRINLPGEIDSAKSCPLCKGCWYNCGWHLAALMANLEESPNANMTTSPEAGQE